MSQMRFLCDEDVPRSYQTALIRREPAIDALRIDDSDDASVVTSRY